MNRRYFISVETALGREALIGPFAYVWQVTQYMRRWKFGPENLIVEVSDLAAGACA